MVFLAKWSKLHTAISVRTHLDNLQAKVIVTPYLTLSNLFLPIAYFLSIEMYINQSGSSTLVKAFQSKLFLGL